MQYRQLGRSGLKVSPICLGTMMFGGPTDEAASKRIIAKAHEAGINFIDTADAYSKGASEEVVGRAIGNNRHAWVLATKLANPMGTDPNRVGLSRRWVLQAADESLKRLGTDHIDIYYLHKEDHTTPLEETVRAMGDLIRAGKVRYFGVSNYRAWRVAEICNICDRLGIDRPAVSQPYYNAMNRMPEVEHFPACSYYGLGIVPYSPLARGVLTGKYKPDAAPDKESRAGRNDTRMMQTEWRPESLQLAQEIKAHAEKKGITAGQFAVAWVLNSAFVSSIVAGPRTEEQWDGYTGALDYLHCGGRGADRQTGRARSSVDAGLQRPGLSDRRTSRADGLRRRHEWPSKIATAYRSLPLRPRRHPLIARALTSCSRAGPARRRCWSARLRPIRILRWPISPAPACMASISKAIWHGRRRPSRASSW
ncbi:aryl-alcohol dehydrogenase-like predicted oxidoreductase [Bradyrhizobium sp. F1.2.2]